MKLIELLNLPVFQGTSVIAGTQGMEREVNTVNMMDAPDIINFLKKNELLITTAFHFKDDLHLLLELIQEMAKQGCSGLAIKTKRYLDKIPEAAVSLANELQLPLLELPIQTSLGDIVNKSLSYILDIRTNELHNAIQTHRQFTNHILSGMGIDKILDSLSSLIQLPVVLLNHYLQPIIQNYSQLTLLDNLEDVIISQLHPLSKTSPSAFSLLNETRDSITLFPISTHKQTNFLCIIGFVPLTDRNKILTIEQASNVIAFELMKENALKQNQRRIQNDFFTNFINGTFSTDEEIINRGKEFGLLSDQRYVCAVGKAVLKEKSIPFMKYQTEHEFIYEKIDSDLRFFHQEVHLFTTNNLYILLMPLKEGWKEIEDEFISFLKTLQIKVSVHYQVELSFGISNYAQHLINFPVSYKEAMDALYYGSMSGKQRFIDIYQPKEIPEILRMVPYQDLKKFYMDTFQSFANEYKKDYHLLLQTLSVYLETHCQLAETAKRLYVHRNTVIYRLEKCEEIIGRSLKEPEETLRLRLAFRIKALIQENNIWSRT